MRRTIAILFQDGSLIPTLTVAHNIAFHTGLANLQQHDGEALLEHLDIADMTHRYPDQLSAASGSGQRWPAPL